MAASDPAIIERASLDGLLDALRRRGYTVIGPTVRSQSLVYDELRSSADLPAGWVDVQEGGTFCLQRDADAHGALFAHTVGHDSLKRFLFPPAIAVWRARRGDDGTLEVTEPAPPPRYAFIGPRSCDLHAVAIQDRVFMGDRYVDPDYEARRRDAFLVAVRHRRRRHHPRGAHRAAHLPEPGAHRGEPARLRPGPRRPWRR
jgi:sulfhydrogenase subunit beta (sulfur reductase)